MDSAVTGLPEDMKLDNQLCFSIYAASRAITRAYRPLLDPLGLTYPQYLVLLTLWEHNGQSINEIGCRLHLDSGTLTPLLKRMEQNHLLRRQRSAFDERRVEVWLEPRGVQLQEPASKLPEQMAQLSHVDHTEACRTKAFVDQVLTKMLDCVTDDCP